MRYREVIVIALKKLIPVVLVENFALKRENCIVLYRYHIFLKKFKKTAQNDRKEKAEFDKPFCFA